MKLSNLISLFALSAIVSAKDIKELEIDITKRVPISKCQKAISGDTVAVHYTGKLLSNGKVFDSSYTRGQPIEFVLGSGRVIKGWDEGILGMCVGEKRTLRIPSSMAYGARGIPGVIPENSALVFDTELVSTHK